MGTTLSMRSATGKSKAKRLRYLSRNNPEERLMNHSAQMLAAAQAGGGYGEYAGAKNAGYAGDTAIRPPEIPRYSEELEKNLHACSAALDQLENKLSNVAYSDPPNPVSAAGAQLAAATQTGMGRQMQEMSGHASVIHQRISSLIRRLEV